MVTGEIPLREPGVPSVLQGQIRAVLGASRGNSEENSGTIRVLIGFLRAILPRFRTTAWTPFQGECKENGELSLEITTILFDFKKHIEHNHRSNKDRHPLTDT